MWRGPNLVGLGMMTVTGTSMRMRFFGAIETTRAILPSNSTASPTLNLGD